MSIDNENENSSGHSYHQKNENKGAIEMTMEKSKTKRGTTKTMPAEEVLKKLRKEYPTNSHLVQQTIEYIREERLNESNFAELLERFGRRARARRNLVFEEGSADAAPVDILMKHNREHPFREFTLADIAAQLHRSENDISNIENRPTKIRKIDTFMFYLEAFSLIYDCSPLEFVSDRENTEFVYKKKKWEDMRVPMQFSISDHTEKCVRLAIIRLFGDQAAQKGGIELNERLSKDLMAITCCSRGNYDRMVETIEEFAVIRKLREMIGTIEYQIEVGLDDANRKLTECGEPLHAQYYEWSNVLHSREKMGELLALVSFASEKGKELLCSWIESEFELRGLRTFSQSAQGF